MEVEVDASRVPLLLELTLQRVYDEGPKYAVSAQESSSVEGTNASTVFPEPTEKSFC